MNTKNEAIDSLIQKCLPILELEKKYKEKTNITNCGRKPRLTDEFYLRYILIVLIEGITWDALNLFKIGCDSSTIRKKYSSWVTRGYIDQFHLLLLKHYSDYKCEHEINNDIYGDSTTVINYHGLKQNTGIGIKFRSKQAVTLHTQCDINRIITSMNLCPANESDISQVEYLIENSLIPINGTYRNPVYLGCDKAYISKDVSSSLKLKNIILTCPPKQYGKKQKIKPINKNNLKKATCMTKKQFENNKRYKKKKQIEKTKKTKLNKRLKKLIKKHTKKLPKKRISNKRKDVLKKRITVEHSYNVLKRGYKRLNGMRERNPNNYISFVKLANSIEIIKFLSLHNNNIVN